MRKIRDTVARINTRYILTKDVKDSSCSRFGEFILFLGEKSLNMKMNNVIILSARMIIFLPFSSLSSSKYVIPPDIKDKYDIRSAIT